MRELAPDVLGELEPVRVLGVNTDPVIGPVHPLHQAGHVGVRLVHVAKNILHVVLVEELAVLVGAIVLRPQMETADGEAATEGPGTPAAVPVPLQSSHVVAAELGRLGAPCHPDVEHVIRGADSIQAPADLHPRTIAIGPLNR